MEKLVFDYTYCSEPECWEWNVPFEYESKEKFIFDVLENPMILDKLRITSVYQFQIDEGTIFEEDYIKNIDEYVLTLDEWFDKNKTKPKNKALNKALVIKPLPDCKICNDRGWCEDGDRCICVRQWDRG
jgi:hypothetical protein